MASKSHLRGIAISVILAGIILIVVGAVPVPTDWVGWATYCAGARLLVPVKPLRLRTLPGGGQQAAVKTPS